MRFESYDNSVPPLWQQTGRGVVLSWLLAAAAAGYFAVLFPGSTTLDANPPPRSASERGTHAMKRWFPGVSNSAQISLVIDSEYPVFPDVACVQEYTEYVVRDLDAYIKAHPDQFPRDLVYCVAGAYGTAGTPGFDMCHMFGPASRSLVSEDERMTLILLVFADPVHSVSYSDTSASKLSHYAAHLKHSVVPAFQGSFPTCRHFRARPSGLIMVGVDAKAAAHFGAWIPLIVGVVSAFGICLLSLSSARLFLVPAAVLLVSWSVSFGISFAVAKLSGLLIMPTVPPLASSALVALSFCLTLPFCSRFREAVDCGFSAKETINAVLAPETLSSVLLSGFLSLVAALSSLVAGIMPVYGHAVVFAIVAFVTTAASVTLTVGLLCAFPLFFSVKFDWKDIRVHTTIADFRTKPKPEADRAQRDDSSTIFSDGEGGETHGKGVNNTRPRAASLGTYHSVDLQSRPGEDGARDLRVDEQSGQVLYRFAKFTQRMAPWCVLAVAAVGCPFFAAIPKINTCVDMLEFAPRDASSVAAWRDMSDKFPGSLFLPFYLLITDVSKGQLNGVNTSEGYSFLNDLTDDITMHTQLASQKNPRLFLESIVQVPNDFLIIDRCAPDPNVSWNGEITWEYLYSPEHGLYINGSDFNPDSRDDCRLAYDGITALQLSSLNNPKYSNTATYMWMIPPLLPTGHDAQVFMSEIDAIAAEYMASFPEYKIHLVGGNTVQRDFRSTTNTMDYVSGAVFMVILALSLYILLRSLVSTAQIVFATAHTLCTAIGALYYVFDTSAFHWLFPFLSDFPNRSIVWLVPAVSTALVPWLCADADFFFYTRLYEHRITFSYNTPASIIKGSLASAPVNLASASISLLTFGSLLFSPVVALVEVGALVFIAVTFNLICIRGFLLPSLLFLCKELNWYPRKVPDGVYTEFEFPDAVD
ncbi:hypothetical protein DIPPA_18009 [Diplonema papillatum]|nr:hypothetical protein DIPPA_18009 [Diplonema papillatum]